jgi:hypothetical protein
MTCNSFISVSSIVHTQTVSVDVYLSINVRKDLDQFFTEKISGVPPVSIVLNHGQFTPTVT